MEEEFEDDQPAAHGTASTTAASSMAKTILDHTQYPWDDELQAHVRQDPEDPSVLFAWDIERSAWFPVFRNDLIDRQQSAYNHSFDTIKPPKPKDDSSGDAPPKKGGTKRKPDQQKTTLHMSESSIYVTRLPNDTTVEELSTYFSRCGLILPDAVTGKPRIKLYKDASTNQLKGDALITFFRPESVQLALTLFDDSDLRPGVRIRVEKADFSKQSNAADGTENQETKQQPPKKKSKADKRLQEAQIKKLERQLDWDDEDAVLHEKWQRTVVMKHMFTKTEIEQDPGLILDLKQDIREECEKLGEVTMVNLFEDDPDGTVTVRYKDSQSALACARKMNGRFFAGRMIEADIQRTKFDNISRHKQSITADSEAQEKERLERYAAWLESGGQEGQAEPARPVQKAIASEQVAVTSTGPRSIDVVTQEQ